MKIVGFQNDRPFFPVTVHSGLELSTVVQGAGEIKGEDVQHLPKYVQLLTSQVFLKRPSPSGVPSAIQKVSVAQSTLNKTKLSLLATVTKTVKSTDSYMANKYKRKFREHEISVEGVKRFKAETSKLGTIPRDWEHQHQAPAAADEGAQP